MSDLSPCTLRIEDGIARMTLNRPQNGNALDVAMCESLMENATKIAEEAEVRVVLLQARGKAFCVGGDVAGLAAAGEGRARKLREIVVPLHGALNILSQIDAPMIAAVNGAAAGAGLSLVAAAELAVAARSAKFTMAYTAIGLSPDGGASWTLPRVIGLRRATELALTNRRLDAALALEWGLVNLVVEDADLDQSALRMAQDIAAGATSAFGRVKKLLQAGSTSEFASQLDAELNAILAAGATSEAAEGLAAFMERRKPDFQSDK